MSMPAGMNVVGWYLEPREDGVGQQIVLVQPSDDANEQVEHVARNASELWAAFMAIAADPDLPEAQVVSEDDEGDETEMAASDDIVGVAMDAAEAFLTQAAGPIIGRVAGTAIRNPGRTLELLRMVSRKDRR